MHSLTVDGGGVHLSNVGHRARVVAVAVVAAVAILVASAALPSSSDHGVLAQLRPQAAQAFQAGRDGNHVWAKITRGEVLAGAVSGICRWYAGPIGWYVCPPIAAAARQIIGGASGVWFEIYSTGRIRIGTW